MGNGTWVCFDCREVLRRATTYSGNVSCPTCGHASKYLGTKIPVPAKRRVKEWRKLKEWFQTVSLADLNRVWVSRVRKRHRLEQEIARLAAMPASEGRAKTVRALKKQLAEL
jgi:uncharacterized Zn finger protein (UPF0148 family)